MSILFISGVNDRSEVGVSLDANGNPAYLLNGNASVQYKLPLRDGLAVPYTLFGRGVHQKAPVFQKLPSLVFNQISDADTHRGALQRCAQLCDQLGVPVINHPRAVQQTARDTVSRMLQNIPGVQVPRTVRFRPHSPRAVFRCAEREQISFPYIARVAGDHQGKSMTRLNSEEHLDRLHPLPFDGRGFYLTEYVECRSEDGFWRKQRVVVVDGEPYLVHSLYLDRWMVHASSREFMLQRASWDHYVEHHELAVDQLERVRPVFQEIAQRLQLQFFGVDCNFRPDGTVLVFEANASMNVLDDNNMAGRYRLDGIETLLWGMLEKYSGESVR